MIIHEVQQGTEEWFALRRGIPTASDFGKILTSQGKPSTSATTYMHSLIAERLSGGEVDQYTNEWMERGKIMEAEARNLFEFEIDLDIPQVGFITNDEITVGCSPDGWNGEIGLEIKCPKASTHVKYLLGGKCPSDYIPQVQGCMYLTGAESWWFMSYHPDIKPLIIEVKADLEWHEKLATELKKFNAKLESSIHKLKAAA